MARTLKVLGVVPPGTMWYRMFNVKDSCIKAQVPIPEEVEEYFENASAEGLYIALEYTDIGDMNSDGVEVKVADIPQGVTAVQVIYKY